MGAFLSVAGPRLDALHDLVGASGCSVLLTDAGGIVLDRRASVADAAAFDAWARTQPAPAAGAGRIGADGRVP
ncbi:MAG TPA: sigma-54-dependent Fis family transcriptional regulator, partial [Paracoccus sp. (in: a-proteobacteria)]|nr:sigma-54-dependent Fis family transcriptional regulator [Paracoccus sp. (in: a-proteobacteria)]